MQYPLLFSKDCNDFKFKLQILFKKWIEFTIYKIDSGLLCINPLFWFNNNESLNIMHHPWSLLRKEICFRRNYAQCYNILKSFKLKTFRCTCHLNLNSFYGRVDYNILLKVINSYVCRCVYICYALSKENVIYEKQKVFMSTCFNFL